MLQPNPDRSLRLIPDLGSVLGQGLWVPETRFRPMTVLAATSMWLPESRRLQLDTPILGDVADSL